MEFKKNSEVNKYLTWLFKIVSLKTSLLVCKTSQIFEALTEFESLFKTSGIKTPKPFDLQRIGLKVKKNFKVIVN